MSIIFLVFAAICLVAAIIIGIDMLRFGRAKRKAENPKSGRVDAGGEIYIQGNKTYYRLPKGEIRKVADYAMDLRPGSPDMNEFTRLMNLAREEHLAEVKETKIKAEANMREIAKAEAKSE